MIEEKQLAAGNKLSREVNFDATRNVPPPVYDTKTKVIYTMSAEGKMLSVLTHSTAMMLS